MATPDLIRLDIVVDEEQYDTVAGLLVRNISYGWEEDSLPTGETRFRVHCDNAIVQENLLSALRAWLPGLDVEQTSIPRQDWTVAWREFFTPVRAGQFIVLPPWLFESTPLEGRKPIIIEPKSAFGTGHHNTTVLWPRSDLPNSWPRGVSRPGSVSSTWARDRASSASPVA